MCDVLLCFVTILCGVLGRVSDLIVSIPDLCLLTYLDTVFKAKAVWHLYIKMWNVPGALQKPKDILVNL